MFGIINNFFSMSISQKSAHVILVTTRSKPIASELAELSQTVNGIPPTHTHAKLGHRIDTIGSNAYSFIYHYTTIYNYWRSDK